MKRCPTAISLCWILGIASRLILTLYAHHHDQLPETLEGHQPAYTDIDYRVFMDGTQWVHAGYSPYRRSTYRYTPLLAYGFLPAFWCTSMPWMQWLCSSWPVLLLMILDGICAWFLQQMQVHPAWILLNPFWIAISTRGNAEGWVLMWVLATGYWLTRAKVNLASFALAMAVLFKVYPVIYLLPVMIYMDSRFCRQHQYARGWLIFNGARIRFLGLFVLIVTAVNYVFYQIYGWEYLDQYLLYHGYRLDHRHNFSAQWLSLYTAHPTSSIFDSSVVSFLSYGRSLHSILMLVLLMVAGLLGKQLWWSLFLQTFVLVHWNKVITSQYFLWYGSLLPLIWSRLSLQSRPKTAGGLLVAWILAQSLWLSQAYRLEMLGQYAFYEIWLAGLVMFAVNATILLFLVHDFYRTTTRTTKDIKVT